MASFNQMVKTRHDSIRTHTLHTSAAGQEKPHWVVPACLHWGQVEHEPNDGLTSGVRMVLRKGAIWAGVADMDAAVANCPGAIAKSEARLTVREQARILRTPSIRRDHKGRAQLKPRSYLGGCERWKGTYLF